MSTLRLCTAAAAAARRGAGAGVGLSTLSSPLRVCSHFAASPQFRTAAAPRQLRQCRFQSTEAHAPSAAIKKELKFTADSYPDLKRNTKYAKITEQDILHFKSILPHASSVLATTTAAATCTQSDLEFFNADWTRQYCGQTALVLKPRSTAQVSEILKYCNSRRLAVVPQGGNTGLVGGSVPIFDEIVVSMSAFNQVRSFDPISGIFICDAGVILENADLYLRERGHIFPLDLGAKGSCHVGGNVATNAGGLRLLRYGSLHGTVLGVEAVLPDGTIVDDLSTLRKNNTGYDMKQLFIGSEGTIGIITGISIQCPLKPLAVNVAYCGVQSFDHACKAFVKTKQQLSEVLSAFELMDGNSQDLMHTVYGKKNPLAKRYPFYILIETSGSNNDHDSAKLEALLEDLLTSEVISDGTQAQSETDIKTFWAWREGIPEATCHWGGVYKYDISLPLNEFYGLVVAAKERCLQAGLLTYKPDSPIIDVVGYGHMGDGNLHLNIPVRTYQDRIEHVLEPFVYEWTQSRRGSISAEHGLGFQKRAYVGYSRGPGILKLMRDVKKHYDPNGIMNPYKYVDE